MSTTTAHDVDVLVIGGGAAGLMCARVAGQRGRSVRVLEHANRVGKKILMSGGGRCNFTNLGVTADNYLSANPHFAKSALARYTPADFITMVETHGIAYHEKERGQLFCDISSKQIVQMLLDECASAGVEILTGCGIQAVHQRGDGFALDTAHGSMTCTSLVVASGGLSIPSMGASGFGYDLARQFGHDVLPTRAGLVPLTLSGRHLEHFSDLAGVAVPEVEASTDTMAFRAGLLFTHRGMSGPAILQISSYWHPGEPVRIDFAPGTALEDWLDAQRQQHPDRELKTALSERVPRRLAQRLCDIDLGNKPLRQYSAPDLLRIGQRLNAWPITASGSEGYRTAEVTLGGVDTKDLSSKTMESKRMPGLYFIGEVVDITGWLGGYNFQWAWASGHAAGLDA